ncbi:hypothetical protein ATE92_2564 [Ulvibacter sp. MAR_2010_11]|uniref:SIMPL domain-containing protein n=1 Tax=Ulvibacter sp. MAR_2010_11 TaxID=1250229 RepID=UPI000C2B5AB0|nr:SIMPL domain-containing protein [Ulvibacter sp. MAR_2010_11]PKA84376.1 hypothetical protein ATE92_2564 [Ulvibacter sp. MAR_2010_11]
MKKICTLLILFTTLIMTGQTKPEATVDVTGEGIVYVVPDEVNITVRVENTGKNPKELKQENDRVVNSVFAFIKSMGIDNKYVKTEYIQLNKNYEYNTKTYTYAANQSISIKLKDLSKYESLMNGLLETGINRIDGISFESSKKASLESEARKKAVANAKMKAEEYASVLNQSIGKAVSISEFQASTFPQPMYKSAMMAQESSGDQQTIAPGEMEIRLTVNVSFLLN